MEIKLTIDKKAVDVLKQQMYFKKICGNLHGDLDYFVGIILQALEKGDKEIKITFTNGRRKV